MFICYIELTFLKLCLKFINLLIHNKIEVNFRTFNQNTLFDGINLYIFNDYM